MRLQRQMRLRLLLRQEGTRSGNPSARATSHPILNKIPYVNRLFKTTGVVQETETANPRKFHFSIGFARQTEAKPCNEACESCSKKEPIRCVPSASNEEIGGLKQAYHNLGYFDVQVKQSCAAADCQGANCESCSKKCGSAQAQLTIEKGPRFRVRKIYFHGRPISLDEEQLRANMELEPGQPFDGRKLARDVSTLKENYGFTALEAVPQFLETPGVCDLVYQIVAADRNQAPTACPPPEAKVQPVEWQTVVRQLVCTGSDRPATSGQSKPTQITIRATSDGVELTTSNGTKLHAKQIQLETNHIGRLLIESAQDSPKPN